MYGNVSFILLSPYISPSPTLSPMCVYVSCLAVSNSAAPYTVAHQAPLSTGFSRQEHWSGLPFPSPKGATERKKVKSLSRVRLFGTP